MVVKGLYNQSREGYCTQYYIVTKMLFGSHLCFLPLLRQTYRNQNFRFILCLAQANNYLYKDVRYCENKRYIEIIEYILYIYK